MSISREDFSRAGGRTAGIYARAGEAGGARRDGCASEVCERALKTSIEAWTSSATAGVKSGAVPGAGRTERVQWQRTQ